LRHAFVNALSERYLAPTTVRWRTTRDAQFCGSAIQDGNIDTATNTESRIRFSCSKICPELSVQCTPLLVFSTCDWVRLELFARCRFVLLQTTRTHDYNSFSFQELQY